MEIRAYGSRALLVRPRLEVPLGHDDVVEVVPGAVSTLVVVRDATRLDSVRSWIGALEDAGTSETSSGREVVLDVVYDGTDLADVAAASGLSTEDVVAVHTAGSYRCDFCGFAPGFAYLSGLDDRLVLPRRPTPRISVPAGSVAIAGPYTAVYPSSSPGGWHLLGHTDVRLWDLDADPPALVAPGTIVRFRPVEHPPNWVSTVSESRPPAPRSVHGMEAAQIGATGRPVLRVVAAGVATSVQDRGRSGYGHLAVPPSGAIDPARGELVNRLVGNRQDAAVLETGGGLVLEAMAPVVVADSTSSSVRTLPAGATVSLNPSPGDVWSYLAARGGIAVEQVLGSSSWDSLSGLGHRPLQPGDEIRVGDDPGTPVTIDQAPPALDDESAPIRVSTGPHDGWFSADSFEKFTNTTWTVSTSSRVGVRLSGQALARRLDTELPSEGLVTGAVQVPPDGQPVVLLNDHPTTGGYPVIGVVADGDVVRLAQRAPGAAVRFVAY